MDFRRLIDRFTGKLKDYHVFYKPVGEDFYQSTVIQARNSEEAARLFDTTYGYCRRMFVLEP